MPKIDGLRCRICKTLLNADGSFACECPEMPGFTAQTEPDTGWPKPKFPVFGGKLKDPEAPEDPMQHIGANVSTVDNATFVKEGGAGKMLEPSWAQEQEPIPQAWKLPPNTFEALGLEVGKLVDEKQRAYGDSFGRSGAVLRALYPTGVQPQEYDDMLAIVRIVDKLFRVATHGSKDPMKESPGRDIAGYGLLMANRHERGEVK